MDHVLAMNSDFRQYLFKGIIFNYIFL